MDPYKGVGSTVVGGCILVIVLVAVVVWGLISGLGAVADAFSDWNNAEANRIEAQAELTYAQAEKAAQQARDNRADYMLYTTTLAIITHDPIFWLCGACLVGIFFAFRELRPRY